MDTRAQMHILLEASALAALVKSMLPEWVRPDTPRDKFNRPFDKVRIPTEQDYYVQDQPWFKAGQDPPASEPVQPTVGIELTFVRVRSESVSLMNFDFGLGFSSKVGENGMVFYWVDDPLPDYLFKGDEIWVDTATHLGLMQ